MFEISTKSVHFRRNYSRTRESRSFGRKSICNIRLRAHKKLIAVFLIQDRSERIATITVRSLRALSLNAPLGLLLRRRRYDPTYNSRPTGCAVACSKTDYQLLPTHVQD